MAKDFVIPNLGEGIEQATIVALRDAGAKLMLDFYRIPAIYGWMQQRAAAGEEP